MDIKRFLIVLSCIFFLLTIINYSISRRIESEKTSIAQPVKVVVHPVDKKGKSRGGPRTDIHYKLVPQDPAKYGFVSHPKKAKMPSTVAEWEHHFKKVMENNQVFAGENGQEALKTMETSPEAFQKQTSTVSEHIAMYENKRKEEPLNVEVGETLQRLYRLKALGKVLEEKVVHDPQAPNYHPPSMNTP